MQAGLRRRLILAAALATAIGLGAFTVAFNLVLAHRLDADAANVLRSRAQAQLADLALGPRGLTVHETQADAVLERVWVFAGTRALERPPAKPPLQAAADRLARVERSTSRDVEPDNRLLAQPVRLRGRHVGAIVAVVSLVPYEHTARLALVSSLILDGVILLLVVGLARVAVGRALRPVARMTAQAAEWSERDLDRRFALGPPRDELTALAATLDGLLGRLSASLRREQRFSAEVAHELRTPLANLRVETELALSRDRTPDQLRVAIESVQAQADRMASVVGTLIAAAEREADPQRGTVDAHEAALAARTGCAPLATEQDMTVVVEPSPGRIEVDVDAEFAAQILRPIVDNGLRYGGSAVTLSVTREGGAVLFTVCDDGPGVRREELEAVFAPGTRGSAADGQRGTGLGLALARRLARSAGGDVVARGGRSGGCFVVRLPAS